MVPSLTDGQTSSSTDVRRVSRGWCRRSCYCQVEILKMWWKKLTLLKSNSLIALDCALSSARYLDSTTSPPTPQLGLQNEVLSRHNSFLGMIHPLPQPAEVKNPIHIHWPLGACSTHSSVQTSSWEIGCESLWYVIFPYRERDADAVIKKRECLSLRDSCNAASDCLCSWSFCSYNTHNLDLEYFISQRKKLTSHTCPISPCSL